MSLTRRVPQQTQALTANGGTDGYATVASTASFIEGSAASIYSDAAPAKDCIITEVLPTKVGLRFVGVSGFGRSDLSAYLTTDNAKVVQQERNIQTWHTQPTP
jgi:hypothetical protein